MNEFLVRPRRSSKPRRFEAKQGIISRFRNEEDGVMVAFAVILVIMMVAIGGVGADMMKAEMERTRLQHTLDRAVLAAADLDQEREPTAVVEDYFDKSGVDVNAVTTNSETIPIFEGGPPIYRKVSAIADAQSTFHASEVAARLRHAWRGDIEEREFVEKVDIRAAGTAVESIGNVEISMVLDVSGSMNSNSRLTNLKIAAREFIDTMDDNTIDGTLSVSIVPYATQVSIPDSLMSELSTSGENAHSNCINFSSSDYASTRISQHATYQRTMHFDPWYRYDNRDSSPSPVNTMPVCEFEDSREAMVMESDRDTLKNYISNLTARGNTSIDVGMKWGTALVDPTFEPIAANLIGKGNVSDDFAERL